MKCKQHLLLRADVICNYGGQWNPCCWPSKLIACYHPGFFTLTFWLQFSAGDKCRPFCRLDSKMLLTNVDGVAWVWGYWTELNRRRAKGGPCPKALTPVFSFSFLPYPARGGLSISGCRRSGLCICECALVLEPLARFHGMLNSCQRSEIRMIEVQFPDCNIFKYHLLQDIITKNKGINIKPPRSTLPQNKWTMRSLHHAPFILIFAAYCGYWLSDWMAINSAIDNSMVLFPFIFLRASTTSKKGITTSHYYPENCLHHSP